MPERPNLRQFAIAYGTALVAMLILDGFWLGWAARDFYRREMVAVMTDQVRLIPAALFYLLYPLGIIYFGLMRPLHSASGAAMRCALVGLFAYGTYDLTALSVMRDWSAQLSLVDMAWGAFATAAVGALTYRVTTGAA